MFVLLFFNKEISIENTILKEFTPIYHPATKCRIYWSKNRRTDIGTIVNIYNLTDLKIIDIEDFPSPDKNMEEWSVEYIINVFKDYIDYDPMRYSELD
jgi:hypothetical protein